MLEKNFKQLCQNFSTQNSLINQLWLEIKISHNNPKRHYHTLVHLANIDKERQKLRLSVQDNIIFQFATYYHDIIYDIEAKDNEEQSATLAKKRLAQLTVPKHIINEIYKLIILTKKHSKTDKITHAYFLDADLAILGSSWDEYQQYTTQIRKEYGVYSDEIYNRGRKRVLEHFFNQEYIYQSEYFRNRYEKKARKNITKYLSKINFKKIGNDGFSLAIFGAKASDSI